MSGNYSRNKGKRVEYLVRDRVREEGYEAHRVPSSGNSQGFKGDIVVKSPYAEYELEVKARKNYFKSIYEIMDVYDAFILHLALTDTSELVSISTTLTGLVYPPERGPLFIPPSMPRDNKAVKKLIKIKELLGTSDILVIKDDNKPPLFIRYS